MRIVVSKYGLIVLLLLAIIGSLGLWFLRRSGISPERIRNVLLISIDTCRADYLSCYGYKSKTTPNIDALAAQGILFENAISPIPQTLPAHSSMLTGTIPPYHGVHDNFGSYLADESNVTLAEILKGAGFTTAAAISALPLDSEFGIGQGFDNYYDSFGRVFQGERVQQRQGGETTDLTLKWLETNKDKRFFFFLHYFDPHAAYEPPEPFASRFASNLYAGEIAYTDHCIGRVLDKLKELDLYDSTLVIITSDHGEMLGEHGELTHTYFIYQAAIKVPLIFKLPGQNKSARIKSIVGLIDIVPTVCGLLNIETPKNVQGVDLFASLKGGNTSAQDRHIFCESLFPTKYKANSLLGVVNNRYKYIRTTRPELYDLIADPGESNNLVEKEQKLVRIMQDKLAQMLEQSVRKASPDSKVQVDPEIVEKLGTLGYVAGVATVDFSFDQTKDDPKDLVKYNSLASQLLSSLQLMEDEKVELYARQMIQLRPDLPMPYESLGLLAKKQKDYPKAIVSFQKAIEIDPNRALPYEYRGTVYNRMGKYDQGIRDFSKVIELDPSSTNAYSVRGAAYLKTGKYDQGLRDLSKVIELDPSSTDAYNMRGETYLKMGKYDQGIRDFSKVIELDPSSTNAYNMRGATYLKTGKYDQGIRDFSRIIELNPSDDNAYYGRALAHRAKGDLTQANRDFNKAIALNPAWQKFRPKP